MGILVARYQNYNPPSKKENLQPQSCLLPQRDRTGAAPCPCTHPTPAQPEPAQSSLAGADLKFLKNCMTANRKLNYKSHHIKKKYDKRRKQLMRQLLSKDVSNYKSQHSLSTWAIHPESWLQDHDMSDTMTNTVSGPASPTLFFQYHVSGKCLIRKLSVFIFYLNRLFWLITTLLCVGNRCLANPKISFSPFLSFTKNKQISFLSIETLLLDLTHFNRAVSVQLV